MFSFLQGFSLRLIFGHEAIACEQRYSPLLVRQYFSPQHNLFFHDSGPSSPGGPVLSASSLSSRATTSSDSTGPALCTLSFLCVYSFGMAAAMWWVMLTLTWFLSAAFHWVPEAITK